MSLTMHIYNTKEVGFDVSEIVHDIEYTTSILGQAGKLTFVLEKDLTPNSEFQIDVGSIVKFWHSDNDSEEEKPVFLGYVFTISTDKTESCRVVAYDSTRYLQNHENIVVGGETLKYYFNKICNTENFNNPKHPEKNPKIINWDKFIGSIDNEIDGKTFVDVSAFEILSYCMDNYAMNNSLDFSSSKNIAFVDNYLSVDKKSFINPKFYIRDNFGTLELREIFTDFFYNDDGTEKEDFIIVGDESLLTDYQYEVDIDKNTFNEFYAIYNSQENSEKKSQQTLVVAVQAGTLIKNTNTILDGKTFGNNTIPKWGKLRKIVTINQSEVDVRVWQYLKNLVEFYNQPTRSMKINALGYDGLYAGKSFIFSLKKCKINYPVYIISATHYYNGDNHTMDLEVNTNPEMELFS